MNMSGKNKMLGVSRHIALDLDEVLCPFATYLHKHYSKTRRKTCPTKALTNYNFAKHYGITDYESKILVSSFYDSLECEEIRPIEGSQEAIKVLHENHRLSIVTGRQHYAADVTTNFIDKYFPGMFSEIVFTNSFSLDGPETSKQNACKDINAALLIDDNLNTCIDCINEGIEAYVFGDYEWNKDIGVYKHIPRLQNWNEFLL
jgi:uncharacterized HAD superfamily protein